jgi:hypothetical protein
MRARQEEDSDWRSCRLVRAAKKEEERREISRTRCCSTVSRWLDSFSWRAAGEEVESGSGADEDRGGLVERGLEEDVGVLGADDDGRGSNSGRGELNAEELS